MDMFSQEMLDLPLSELPTRVFVLYLCLIMGLHAIWTSK